MANSATTTSIDIDIDVHRAIEARRTGFQQTQNDILRDVLGVNDGSPSLVHRPERPLRTRQTGSFRIEFLGDRFEERSLKDAYIRCLTLLSRRTPGFLEQLSQKSTRSRRIVARLKQDLYLNKPSLAEKFAMPLCDGWWVDTNLSGQQCDSRLEMACEVAGIRFGSDLKLQREVRG